MHIINIKIRSNYIKEILEFIYFNIVVKSYINKNGPKFKDYRISLKEEVKSGLFRVLTMIFTPGQWIKRYPEDPTTKTEWVKFGISRLPFTFTVLSEIIVYGSRQGLVEVWNKIKL